MIELPEVPEATTPETEVASPAPATDNPTGAPVDATAAVPTTPSPSTPVNPAPGEEPKFEIKVDGKVELLTRAEMTALAQQGKSYTQKTQKLADEQRRWEADRAAILQEERAKWKREQADEAARAAAEAGKDPAAKALERVESLEQSLEDQRLESVMKPLLDKYGVDEQQFLIEASKQGLRSSADVAHRGEAIAQALSETQNSRFEARFKEVLSKGEHPDIKAMQAKWLADYLAKKGNPGPSPIPAGARTPSLGEPPKRARTFDEAADIAHEMLTGEAPRA